MTPAPWSLRHSLTRAYLSVDPRSLGLCRIVLGAVLLIDLLRRAPELTLWYTNLGLLPNHTVLWQPLLPRLLSGFFMVSLPHEAVLGFLICAFCFLTFMVGWRTRLFHVLSFLCATSLHNRILFVENWGSVALGALCLWTLFLPMGQRFSVDAVLTSLGQRPENSAAELGPQRAPYASAVPVVSLAVLCVLMQLAVITFFNYAHKSGVTWKTGSAVHYLLHQDRIVTWLGVWLRERMSPAMSQALTWGTMAVEAAAPVLVLTPVAWIWSRRLALVLLSAMYIGTACLLNLGIASAAMLAYLPLLLSPEDWRALVRMRAALARRSPRERVVFFDAGCGVCFQVVRVLARLDALGRLRWFANDDRGALPSDVDPELLQRTILVVDPLTGRRWTRSDGFAEIFATLPFGWLWAWIFRLPLLRTVAGAAYDRFATNRTRISTWLGLAACGIPSAGGGGSPDPPAESDPPATPLPRWARTWRPRVREISVAFTLVVLTSSLLAGNAAVPPALRSSRPEWLEALVTYPDLRQSWSMFSPEAPVTDQMVYVDALTVDGRRVDPYNRAGSRVWELPVTDIPDRLGQSSMFSDYSLRIPHRRVYSQAFLEWVLRFPERTGNPRDRIVSFEAWVVEDTSPVPGETRARGARHRTFLKHPPTP